MVGKLCLGCSYSSNATVKDIETLRSIWDRQYLAHDRMLALAQNLAMSPSNDHQPKHDFLYQIFSRSMQKQLYTLKKLNKAIGVDESNAQKMLQQFMTKPQSIKTGNGVIDQRLRELNSKLAPAIKSGDVDTNKAIEETLKLRDEYEALYLKKITTDKECSVSLLIDSIVASSGSKKSLAQIQSLMTKESLNVPDEFGSYPLLYAAALGDSDSVKLLLAAKHDLNCFDDQGRMPLLVAADDIVKGLLKKTNVNSVKNDTTPLMAAARAGNKIVVCALLRHGARVSFANKNNQTALDIARACGHTEIVQLLVEEQKKQEEKVEKKEEKKTAQALAAREQAHKEQEERARLIQLKLAREKKKLEKKKQKQLLKLAEKKQAALAAQVTEQQVVQSQATTQADTEVLVQVKEVVDTIIDTIAQKEPELWQESVVGMQSNIKVEQAREIETKTLAEQVSKDCPRYDLKKIRALMQHKQALNEWQAAVQDLTLAGVLKDNLTPGLTDALVQDFLLFREQFKHMMRLMAEGSFWSAPRSVVVDAYLKLKLKYRVPSFWNQLLQPSNVHYFWYEMYVLSKHVMDDLHSINNIKRMCGAQHFKIDHHNKKVSMP